MLLKKFVAVWAEMGDVLSTDGNERRSSPPLRFRGLAHLGFTQGFSGLP